jgi:hypothetical protein
MNALATVTLIEGPATWPHRDHRIEGEGYPRVRSVPRVRARARDKGR